MLNDLNLAILIGRMKGDLLGKLTLIRATDYSSVIDCRCIALDLLPYVYNFKIDTQIFSDHMHIVLSLNTNMNPSNRLVPLPKLR